MDKKIPKHTLMADNYISSLCEIDHPWNHLFYLSKEDLEQIGPWPKLSKYIGSVDFRVVHADKMFDFLFARLTNVEPLFFKISPEFKKLLKDAINIACLHRNGHRQGYFNQITWISVYFSLKGTQRISKFYPEDNPVDLELWNKIHIPSFNSQISHLVGPNFSKDFDKALGLTETDNEKTRSQITKGYNRKVS